MKKLYLLLVILPMIYSCDMLKTHISDCTFDYSNKLVYKDGKFYDGTLYSDDGEFCKIKVNKGNFIETHFYHNNGTVAVFFDMANGEEYYFDEDGCALERYDFKEKYSYIMTKIDGVNSVIKKHRIDKK